MSLERKDVRVKLDPQWHGALVAIADAEGSDIGTWVETLIVEELKRRFRSATLLAQLAERLGISGKGGE
jgi:hypothetical protein